ncbi:crossover junction endodeoxyribonuclease RuvC [Coriobacterium glomerans PW2]|uniref:Crossover junction endodeoxyribonuclease RuvC n=1 Tax=Coriobacterium glomerans (strain ATCC 49209 / DSM 20642 / JCM 10262 / PW2) TaxID=700015 RepID=F2N885_CORGP|nr:crossover junction endodeoxyribonuclease RuvC [Coriobacterium glomerans]AEB07268.1 crossover junction endodeoxyribonuclease RuvC [Coriobacterium glomerans PW2]
MVVLGIDPGLANTGWGVVEERSGDVRCRAYGCIQTASGSPLAVRLRRIADDLRAVVERYRPQTAAIEDIYFGVNVRSAIPTAHARGAALVACSLAGMDVGEYTPMQIKQAVVGTGAADKAQIAYMVRRLLQLDREPRPDHAADALACAICHAHLVRTAALTDGRFTQTKGSAYA